MNSSPNIYGSPGQQFQACASSFQMLRKRYLDCGWDIFGLGTNLNATRFGAYVQRLTDQLAKNSINGEEALKIKSPGSWDFIDYKLAEKSVSKYVEPAVVVDPDLILWSKLEALTFEFNVDLMGHLQIWAIHGYVSYFMKI